MENLSRSSGNHAWFFENHDRSEKNHDRIWIFHDRFLERVSWFERGATGFQNFTTVL